MEAENFILVKDDALEVWLFPSISPGVCLDDILLDVKNRIKILTGQYIWHKEAFDVNLPLILEANLNKDVPPHLYSLTYFGDNIDDEWFIVYILIEITKQCPDLIVKLTDSDGEFLLIEAADALPKWANPDTCENRVYLQNGSFHLIPPKLLNNERELTINEAVNFIRHNSEKTKASYEIQNAIQERISKYSNGISECFHRAIVSIPLKYAALLQMQPQIISHVVNAYCNRDTIESRACKQVTLDNCIDITVTFTKCLYAMLTHSKLIFEPSWKMPPQNTLQYKRKSLGIKLSCGFAILLNQASDNQFESRNWRMFHESLKKNGYFKRNLEGSKDYKILLENAKKFFLENECKNSNSFIGQKLKDMLVSSDFNENINLTKNTTLELDEDNDDWMNVNPEELDELLNKRFGKKYSTSAKENITPDTITSKLTTFLNKSSNLEGIDVRNGDDSDGEENDNQINFEPEQFENILKNMLDLTIPSDDWNLDSGTDLSDYNSDEDMKTINKDMCYMREIDEELIENNIFSSDSRNNPYSNLKQSLKEEKGSFGPSSSILSNIGIDKRHIATLDSDDDEE